VSRRRLPVLLLFEEVGTALLLGWVTLLFVKPPEFALDLLAARLVPAAVVTFVLPGYLVLRWRARETEDVAELAPVSFAASFLALTVLCVVTMESSGNSRRAGSIALGLAWAGWLAVMIRRAPPLFVFRLVEDLRGITEAPRAMRLAVMGLALTLGALLHVVGARIYAPEELVIARKYLENPVIRLDNVMHMPGVTQTYLYGPFTFATALVARLSALDVILVLFKLQGVLAAIALLTFHTLCRVVFGNDRLAAWGALVAGVLVLADPVSWAYGTGLLIPFPNRYGVAPGLFLPLAMAIALKAVAGQGRLFTVVTPLFALAMAMVHAREGVQFLFWLVPAGAVFAVTAIRPTERKQALTRVAGMTFAVLGLFLAYMLRQQALVPHVGAVTGALKEGMDAYLRAAGPSRLLTGTIPATLSTPIGDYNFDNFSPLFFNLWEAAVGFPITLGIALAPLLILFRRARWAPVAAVSLLVPLLFLRVPLLYVLFTRAAGSPDVGKLDALLTVWALVVFAALTHVLALGLEALASWAVSLARGEGLSWHERTWLVLGSPAAAYATSALALLGLAGTVASVCARRPAAAAAAMLLAVPAALLWAWRRPLADPIVAPGHAWGHWVLGLAVVAPFLAAAPRRGPTLRNAAADPSAHVEVTDLRNPYPQMKKHLPSDLPGELIRYIRENVPPLQVFIYPHERIGSITHYLDQFVAHGMAGDVLSTDLEYARRFVQEGRHPVYNFEPYEKIRDLTLDFLDTFGVQYAIVGPPYDRHLEAIFARFNAEAPVFERVYHLRRFSVWRVDGHSVRALRTKRFVS
jgi:hypothetical protein